VTPPAFRGLLVPAGPQARTALLGQLATLGPLDRRATPDQQALRARLETLASLVPRALPAPQVRKVIQGQPDPPALTVLRVPMVRKVRLARRGHRG